MIQPERFEEGAAMLCVGIRRQHGFADAARTIAAQWEEFRALCPVPGAKSDVVYGIMCGTGADAFEYMTGVEVAAFEDAPTGLGRIRIPAQTYAVFAVPEPSAIGPTWMSIWGDWIPQSRYELGHTPEFERYASGFGSNGAGSSPIEIWASVRPRG